MGHIIKIALVHTAANNGACSFHIFKLRKNAGLVFKKTHMKFPDCRHKK